MAGSVEQRTHDRWRLTGALGVVAALVWSMLRAGPTVTPALDSLVAAARIWPQRLPDEFAAFYTDSPLGLLLARTLGLGTAGSYLWLSLVATTAAALSLAAWAWITAPASQRWRAARLTVLAPVVGVMAAWLGFYDPWTMLAWAVVLFAWLSGSRTLLVLSGVLVGFQHFEHGLLGLIALVLVWHAVSHDVPSRLRLSNPGWSLVGIFAGKAVLLTMFLASESSATGRASWVGVYVGDWTKVAVNTAPILLWSLFAGSWAIVVAFWMSQPRARARLALLAALMVGLAATALSGDRPRVFVIVMAPALLLLTIAYLQRRQDQTTELRIVESVVWLAPVVTLWGAEVVYANVIDQLVTTWQALTG